MDRKGLKWFGHVKRMSVEWLNKKCASLTLKKEGIELGLSWSPKGKACNARALELRDAKVICIDTEQ